LTLREVLNRILWDKRENPEDCEITFIHRGVYMDRKRLNCNLITEVKSSYFTYEEGKEEVIIPLHRVVEVRNLRAGRVMWSKRLGKTTV
jgi:uncharacterized protein (UPF0248 family)